MNFFEYKNEELYCEDLPVAEIAKAVGTPFYLYSYRTLERHFKVFDTAFEGMPHLTCYSCKANSNVAILGIMRKLGGGVDIVSGGELFRALSAGVPPQKIVFSGVGKTPEEIRYAVKSGIMMLNVESEGELEAVARVGRELKREVPVSIRVNPEVDPKTHPYITTGLRKNKFGLLWEDARKLYGSMKKEQYLNPIGISSHIGSQILELTPFVDAVRSLKEMILELSRDGMVLRYMDIGGGLGITYKDELPPQPADYAAVIEKEMKGLNILLVLEPGRVLVGNSGIFVTKLLYTKRTPEKVFYIVDGAMNDLVRPALYDAYHEVLPVRKSGSDTVKVDLVGPVCESGDFFARGRFLPSMLPGELVAVMGAGAYGFAMSSNYNSRRRVPEVLVRDQEFHVIRRRETKKSLIRGEAIPPFLEV
jgi:diaminopimelate decarboxylase